MNSEVWQRVKNLVGEALEQPKSDRIRFIAASEENTTVRREAESILAQSDQRLEVCAENVSALDTDSLIANTRVGAYRIIRELGRGGMGAVFLAERADAAFQKQVAIKILKRGTDTEEVLRRFRAERQILGRLTHPNIAQLFDAGETDNGLPYFVMEYVDGCPITAYSDERKLAVAERLNLFRAVCSAVGYAHQNLVIHRDLKSANVLVTKSGEVKLLDFGIAKLVDESAPNLTLTIDRRLTPEYASPEQVNGDPVTTLSDVYSLGVLLYELLTGERPYKPKSRSAEEINKAIREREPGKPSTVAAKTGPQSAMRNPKLLRGDLDNIVLKALSKEPERRYASADQFSADIGRHLEGLPVRARKDTAAYRTVKFIRRHKLGVAALALVAFALIAGSITTSWQAREARREKALADQRFEQVRKLAHSVLFDYHDKIATLPGSTKVREQMVKDSLVYLDGLAKQAGTNKDLQRELAAAYLKVGDVQGRAFRANLGDSKGAMESYRKSLAIRQRLTALEPNRPELREELGTTYERIGGLNLFLGNPNAALENVQKAVGIYEKLLVEEPTNRPARAELALYYEWLGLTSGASAVNNLGDVKAAFGYYRKAIAILEPLVAQEPTNSTYRNYLEAVYGYIAQLYSDTGDQIEAVDSYRKSLAISKTLAKDNPTDMFLQREIAVNYSNLCGVMILAGDNTSAVENCRQAVPIFEAISASDPNDKNMRLDGAIIHRKLAEALGKVNDRPGALKEFQVALRIFDELSANTSKGDYRLRQQGLAYLRLSEFLSNTGNIAGAIENGQHAREIFESLVATDAKNVVASKYLALTDAQFGKCRILLASSPETSNERINNWRSAKDWYQQSLKIWERLQSEHKLAGADSNKPAEIASEIAKCEAALNR